MVIPGLVATVLGIIVRAFTTGTNVSNAVMSYHVKHSSGCNIMSFIDSMLCVLNVVSRLAYLWLNYVR